MTNYIVVGCFCFLQFDLKLEPLIFQSFSTLDEDGGSAAAAAGVSGAAAVIAARTEGAAVALTSQTDGPPTLRGARALLSFDLARG